MTAMLPRQAHISWWMEEARADPAMEATSQPPLAGSARADVAIIGGGYTGMWTAWHLLQRSPGIDIAILEADELCGAGPSGRNGGFCYGMWEDLEALVRHFGDTDALRLARAAHASVDEIGSWLTDHDVNAWWTQAGHLTVATSTAQEGAWDSLVGEAARLGVGDLFVELTADQVRQRCSSPLFGAGLLQPTNAIVQPARLALGLRRELLRAGVRIYESSPVVRFDPGPPVIVETPGGELRADSGVLALGAWAASLKRFHRSIVPRGTYIVVTEPAPDRLAEIGWTGGEGLGDWRTALHYLRTTPDGRIAFGAASSTAGRGVGLGPRLRFDEGSVVKLVDDFRRFFPSWDGVELEAAWGGPMDVTGLHQPFFGTWGGLHYGMGYTGGGVGPCHMGGKILSGLVTGADDEWTALPLVHREPRRFPPEPLLSFGAAAAQGAIVRKDEAEDRGGRPDPITGFIARLPRRMGYELGP